MGYGFTMEEISENDIFLIKINHIERGGAIRTKFNSEKGPAVSCGTNRNGRMNDLQPQERNSKIFSRIRNEESYLSFILVRI